MALWYYGITVLLKIGVSCTPFLGGGTLLLMAGESVEVRQKTALQVAEQEFFWAEPR